MLREFEIRCVAVLLSVAVCAGCTRSMYRWKADQEVYALVQEKSHNPDCFLPDFTVQPDPRSRMFDPFSPDHPPMPPDDPAAHRLMHCVDRKKGYPRWHKNEDTPYVESPVWLEYLPMDEDGVLTVNAQCAVELARVNSPDYQKQLETLYLSALDVSSERFRFDTQYFGRTDVQFTADGPVRSGTGRPSSKLALTTLDGRAQKFFTTGAELVVGLANSIVWEFAGSGTNFTTTLLDFSFVQPLLRRAGRERIMETLTLSERTLLANVRQMERFRGGFYLNIVTGRNTGSGPARRGGFFGESGLAGFAGVGGGGFGRVGGTSRAATAGGFGGGGAGAAQAGGYMGLLQMQQDIRNQESNIAGLRSNLNVLQETLKESLQRIPETLEEILRQRLQIAQARQALFNAQSRLLNTENDYQAELDDFKIEMGLPPQLCIRIDDPMLEQFNLIDPEIVTLQNSSNELLENIGVANDILLGVVTQARKTNDNVPNRQVSGQVKRQLERLLEYVGEAQQLCERIRTTNMEHTHDDIEGLKQVIPDRRDHLLRLRDLYQEDSHQPGGPSDVNCPLRVATNVDPAVFDVNRLNTLPAELADKHGRLEDNFQRYAEQLNRLEEELQRLTTDDSDDDPQRLFQHLENEVIFSLPSVLSELVSSVLDLSLLQAQARAEQIQLAPVELASNHAFAIASHCRLDWMNTRAALVDSWRLIEFVADDLEGGLDLTFSGDIGNVGNNPAKLRDTNGRLRIGLEFDTPFTRLQERNTYRQALIEYQQARRNYYTFVDNVSENLRQTLRSMDVNRQNFEQQRLAVLGAIDQIVLNTEIQNLAEQRGESSGVTAARDAVSALTDLLNAQNNFLSVWVNYEVLRRGLDWDLGTMRLDTCGNWLDPGPIGKQYGYPACNPSGVPCGDGYDWAADQVSTVLEEIDEQSQQNGHNGNQRTEHPNRDGNQPFGQPGIPPQPTTADAAADSRHGVAVAGFQDVQISYTDNSFPPHQWRHRLRR